MGTNGLIFLALLPGILIIFYVYKNDKVEKEPWGLILKLIALGALSCVPASFMENFIESALPSYPPGTLMYALTMAFVVAAFCEELCKYFFLRFGSWRNPNFGYRFDGIVYAVAVAVGFALLENVMYVMMGGLHVALMRGVLAVPLHSFCGLFMGVFYGAAKKAQIEGASSFPFRALALIVPMIIHGIYDTLAFMGNQTASIVLLAFVVLMYIVSIRCLKAYSRDDSSSAFYGQGKMLSDLEGGSGYAGNADAMRREGKPAARGYAYGGFGNETDSQRPHPGQIQNGKIIIICPHCRRGLRVPAEAGRIRVKCPSCGGEFEEIT